MSTESFVPPKAEQHTSDSESPEEKAEAVAYEKGAESKGVDTEHVTTESVEIEVTTLAEAEPWPENATAEAYAEYQEPGEVIAYNERKQEYVEAISAWDDYINTAIAEDGHVLSEEELHQGINMRERTMQEMVEVSANYPGDWTGLLYKRLSDPNYKAKFIAQKTEAMQSMNKGALGPLSKAEQSSEHYQEQIDTYDERLAKVFGSVRVGNASEFGRQPLHVGTIEQMGNPAVMFSDATQLDGTPLTSRHKEIILPHEIGHTLRDYMSQDEIREIKLVLDQEVLFELSDKYKSQEKAGTKTTKFRSEYLNKPEEIVERMAQFKNYFGMNASEQFTKKHLDYVREHYVTDTKLDNSVGDLLRCVTPNTEAAFLAVINKYPI